MQRAELMHRVDTTMIDPLEGVSPRDFDSFFQAEYRGLLRTMYLACGNRAEAEELAQATMVRAFERWDVVSAAASPRGYVYKMALNLHRSRLRHLAAALRHTEHLLSPTDPADVAVDRADTLRALRALRLQDREALLLVEWLGMSSDEAGQVLGVAASSVRGRVQRARESFRRILGEHDD